MWDLRWSKLVFMNKKQNEYNILMGKSEGNILREKKSRDETTILKWLLHEHGVRVWIGFIWLTKNINGGIN